MSFFQDQPGLIGPNNRLHLTHNRVAGLLLAVSVALVGTIMAVDLRQSRLTLVVVPILVCVLTLAIVTFVFSLWAVRREQHYADEDCRNADREFSSIFQNVLDGIFILDNETYCLDVNPAGVALLRLAKSDILRKKLSTFFVDQEGFGREWQSLLQTKCKRGQVQVLDSDRATVVVDFSALPNYVPGRHIFILRDVTRRTLAEKALKKSEERFRYVTDRLQEIVWMMSAETKEVVYVNQAYTTVTGYSVESLYRSRSSFQKLVHPRDRIRVFSRLRDAIRAGTFNEEFRFIHANGSVRWIWVQASLAMENGNSRWLVGTGLDITTRKQADQQISEHLDAIEAARAETKALRKATLALSQNLAMDSVLDALLQCIRELVPFDRASVLFVEDATHLMVARESAPRKHTTAGLVLTTMKNAALRRVLFERKPVLLSNTDTESSWIDTVPFDGARSWIGIPLSAAGSTIGILSLCARQPAAFTTEHLRLSRNLAVSAAVAIKNARIHERAEIYASELKLRICELQLTQKPIRTRKLLE